MSEQKDRAEQVLRRLAGHWGEASAALDRTGLSAACDEFCRIPEELLAWLQRERLGVLEWLQQAQAPHSAELAAYLGHWTRWLSARAPYLAVDRALRTAIEQQGRSLLAACQEVLAQAPPVGPRAETLGATLREHHTALLGLLEQALQRAAAPVDSPPPVCAEYSPELQLALLGYVDGQLPAEPVLDLGCGEHGHLVRHLAALGLEVVGLDRLAPDEPPLANGDWLDHPLGRGHWGTILSHMGFSSHFMHEHLRRDGAAEAYARRYMELLRALRPGGSFCYAPGLPFIERLLPPEAYQVELRPLDVLADHPAEHAVRQRLGEGVFYAARITRR